MMDPRYVPEIRLERQGSVVRATLVGADGGVMSDVGETAYDAIGRLIYHQNETFGLKVLWGPNAETSTDEEPPR